MTTKVYYGNKEIAYEIFYLIKNKTQKDYEGVPI